MSDKIDPKYIKILSIINAVTAELGIPFFIVGAFARDIIYKHFEIETIRATRDLDIGIRVKDINMFSILVNTLVEYHGFNSTNCSHRIEKDGILIDIVPFGQIANSEMQIRFPSEDNTIMSVLGFDEGYRYSNTIRINDSHAFEIKIPTIPGLSVMKLISWDEQYPARKKDAQDLLFIMKNHEHTDVVSRLFSIEHTILKEEGFDVRKSSIRLLGKDMAEMSDEITLSKIKQILDDETSQAAYKLISDMQDPPFEDRDEILVLLERLKQGIFE